MTTADDVHTVPKNGAEWCEIKHLPKQANKQNILYICMILILLGIKVI